MYIYTCIYTQLLTRDPNKRLTIEQAFAHPFLQQATKEFSSPKGNYVHKLEVYIYKYIYIYIYVSVYIIHIYVYICILISIYMYIYVHTNTHI
jgi:serine/threonine protein kinase